MVARHGRLSLLVSRARAWFTPGECPPLYRGFGNCAPPVRSEF